MILMKTDEYKREKERNQRMRSLIRRMAGLLQDYDINKIDYQAKRFWKKRKKLRSRNRVAIFFPTCTSSFTPPGLHTPLRVSCSRSTW